MVHLPGMIVNLTCNGAFSPGGDNNFTQVNDVNTSDVSADEKLLIKITKKK